MQGWSEGDFIYRYQIVRLQKAAVYLELGVQMQEPYRKQNVGTKTALWI